MTGHGNINGQSRVSDVQQDRNGNNNNDQQQESNTNHQDNEEGGEVSVGTRESLYCTSFVSFTNCIKLLNCYAGVSRYF